MKHRLTKIVTFRLSEDDYRSLHAQARARHLDVADICREALLSKITSKKTKKNHEQNTHHQ